MSCHAANPRLAGIRLHPIKSLDPVSVNEARIGPGGGLEHDRAWALFSVDGRWVNGKRTAAMHLIRASYAPDLSSVTLAVPGDRRNIPPRTFLFPAGAEDAAEWFSVFFEQQILVRYAAEGFPDETVASGPTIVSTASLQAVCEWFPGVTLDNARQRFRATLEIDGQHGLVGARVSRARLNSSKAVDAELPARTNSHLPAFWEDRLFGEDERSVVRFRIGEVNFEGSHPCARCPVPARDPQTGADLLSFQKRFSELRRDSLPAWAPAARFDHFYRLATNTRVAPTEQGKGLRLGDSVNL
ncbi:MAG TPA: MOSC N-terminal beta barrel domain-containing protein [Candidatus Acidoferrum sp.]|nr:MOSC N-terminal beta barrel domain-containing protein [Candidatus Acidoferrum sp.]